MRFDVSALNEDSYHYISPGGSVYKIFDFTYTHALSSAGPIQVQSTGDIPYANLNSTLPIATHPYESNVLQLHLDQQNVKRSQTAAIANIKRTIPDKETCDEEKLFGLEVTHQRCAKKAAAAAWGISRGVDGAVYVQQFMIWSP